MSDATSRTLLCTVPGCLSPRYAGSPRCERHLLPMTDAIAAHTRKTWPEDENLTIHNGDGTVTTMLTFKGQTREVRR